MVDGRGVHVGLLGLTYHVYTLVPQAFVPEEDAGYFMTLIQAPPGASLEYTTNVIKEAELVMASIPEVESVFSVAGFSCRRQRAELGDDLHAPQAVR